VNHHAQPKDFLVFFSVLWHEIRAFTLSHSTSPILWRVIREGSHELFVQAMILLISASWVARIISVSHQQRLLLCMCVWGWGSGTEIWTLATLAKQVLYCFKPYLQSQRFLIEGSNHNSRIGVLVFLIHCSVLNLYLWSRWVLNGHLCSWKRSERDGIQLGPVMWGKERKEKVTLSSVHKPCQPPGWALGKLFLYSQASLWMAPSTVGWVSVHTSPIGRTLVYPSLQGPSGQPGASARGFSLKRRTKGECWRNLHKNSALRNSCSILLISL
jgi:hypothetical protein